MNYEGTSAQATQGMLALMNRIVATLHAGDTRRVLPQRRAHTVSETKDIAHKRDRHMPLAWKQ